jgi:hypothetical protein
VGCTDFFLGERSFFVFVIIIGSFSMAQSGEIFDHPITIMLIHLGYAGWG